MQREGWGTKERGVDLDLRSYHETKALLQTINLIWTQLVKRTLKIHLWKSELIELGLESDCIRAAKWKERGKNKF